MSKTLDPMDLKQIITLHLDGLSNRKIGETLGISRNTINRYLQLFKGSDYTFSELLKFNEVMPGEQFSVKTTIDNDRYDELMCYLGKSPSAACPSRLYFPVSLPGVQGR